MSTPSEILLQQLLKEFQEMKQGLGLNPTEKPNEPGVIGREGYRKYFLQQQAKRKLKK